MEQRHWETSDAIAQMQKDGIVSVMEESSMADIQEKPSNKQSSEEDVSAEHENEKTKQEAEDDETNVAEKQTPTNALAIDKSNVQVPPLPRNLRAKQGRKSSWPHLTRTSFYDVPDKKRVFMLREPLNVSMNRQVLQWLDSLPWPVVLMIKNLSDWPWPPIDGYNWAGETAHEHEKHHDVPTMNQTTTYMEIIEHQNVKRIYVTNPGLFHPKIHPLPLGLKQGTYNKSLYDSIVMSPEDIKQLFLTKNDPSNTLHHQIFVRPSTPRNHTHFPKTNMALITPREEVCSILIDSAPDSVDPGCLDPSWMSLEEYMNKLKLYRFGTSPVGNGLDCHGTWEILFAGGIPIFPRSTLDPMYDDLPVWLVQDWKEVNDTSVRMKAQEFYKKADSFNWDKIFAFGWYNEIHEIAYSDNNTPVHTDFAAAKASSLDVPTLPRKLRAKMKDSSNAPYLTRTAVYDIVDNERIFFLSPPLVLSTTQLCLEWLDELPFPVVLILKSFDDWPWPPIDGYARWPPVDFHGTPQSAGFRPMEHDNADIVSTNQTTSYTKILEHPRVKRLYTTNPSILHPKLHPLPIGMLEKPKEFNQTLFMSIAKSPDEVKRLFLSKNGPGSNSTSQLYVRPSKPRQLRLYPKTNTALQTPRDQLCDVLTVSAPQSTDPNCHNNGTLLTKDEYFEQLKEHQFSTSPSGIGLDCFATWEILLAGCIPIVPSSTLNPMFVDLPVWVVEDWTEVNDTSVALKSKEFYNKAGSFNWNKIFGKGWLDEIKSAAYP
jgi:hypothetical protein